MSFHRQEEPGVAQMNVVDYYNWWKQLLIGVSGVTLKWIIPDRKFIVHDTINDWAFSFSGLTLGKRTLQHPVLIPALIGD